MMRGGSLVPEWFPPVPGTDNDGSLVPTPLGGNRGTTHLRD